MVFFTTIYPLRALYMAQLSSFLKSSLPYLISIPNINNILSYTLFYFEAFSIK